MHPRHRLPLSCGDHATEGYWQSGGTGVRGHMGAYHRMLSTLVNDLIAAGFVLQRMVEPVGDNGGLASQVQKPADCSVCSGVIDELDGKVAVVSGGGSGIGRATVLALVARCEGRRCTTSMRAAVRRLSR